MLQSEIDEISVAFEDAWQQYFGQVMYYVPVISSTPHPIYGEVTTPQYNFDAKISFYGTFKQEPLDESSEMGGRFEQAKAEITLVTKSLTDKGIKLVSNKDIIELVDKDGNSKLYYIYSHYGKVQLGDNRIFTKLKVIDHS